MYQELVAAMETVGFSEEERLVIHKTLAAILHLSNIQFEAVDEDSCQLKGSSEVGLKQAAAMLGLDADRFQSSLLQIHSITRGEHIKVGWVVN